jgi:hypothetical protein
MGLRCQLGGSVITLDDSVKNVHHPWYSTLAIPEKTSTMVSKKEKEINCPKTDVIAPKRYKIES